MFRTKNVDDSLQPVIYDLKRILLSKDLLTQASKPYHPVHPVHPVKFIVWDIRQDEQDVQDRKS